MNLRRFFSRTDRSKGTNESLERNGIPLSPFEALETLFGLYSTKSNFLARIHNDLRGMGNQSFKLFTRLPFFLPAINEGCLFLEKQGGEQEAIHKLCIRAIQDAERYVKAMLIDDPATCNNVSRDLMEIESLILDFSVDSNRMTLWLEQNESAAKDFAFGSLNKRFKEAANIHKKYATPNYSEYIMHSEHLHVRANSWNFSCGDADTDLHLLCLELTEHLLRVCTAVILFTNQGEYDEVLTRTLQDELSQLNYMRQLSHEMIARANEVLAGEGLKFPDRTVYKISEFPGGLRITPSDHDSRESEPASDLNE